MVPFAAQERSSKAVSTRGSRGFSQILFRRIRGDGKVSGKVQVHASRSTKERILNLSRIFFQRTIWRISNYVLKLSRIFYHRQKIRQKSIQENFSTRSVAPLGRVFGASWERLEDVLVWRWQSIRESSSTYFVKGAKELYLNFPTFFSNVLFGVLFVLGASWARLRGLCIREGLTRFD